MTRHPERRWSAISESSNKRRERFIVPSIAIQPSICLIIAPMLYALIVLKNKLLISPHQKSPSRGIPLKNQSPGAQGRRIPPSLAECAELGQDSRNETGLDMAVESMKGEFPAFT